MTRLGARPRLKFACFLLGGMGLALTIGLLDVFVVHADAIKRQGSASAGLDLALGLPLLIIGILLAAGHLHGRRRAPAPATDEQSASRRDGWAERILHQPWFGLAVITGAVTQVRRAANPEAVNWRLTSGRASLNRGWLDNRCHHCAAGIEPCPVVGGSAE